MSESEAVEPGHLYWIEFDPTLGTEQRGRRPALIVSDEAYNARSGRALIMPMTSRVRGDPFEVVVDTGPAIGAVLVDQIRCVDLRARYAKRIGRAPDGVLEEAREKLASLIGAA